MDELTSLLTTVSAFISGFSVFELAGMGLVGAITALGAIDTKRGNVWRDRLIKLYKLYSKSRELRSQLSTYKRDFVKSEKLYNKADKKLQKDSNTGRSIKSAQNIMLEAEYYRKKSVQTKQALQKAMDELPAEQVRLAKKIKLQLMP